MPYLASRGGHAPGHLREALLEWIGNTEAFEVAVGYSEMVKPIKWVFGQLWNCTDILPGSVVQDLQDIDIDVHERRTYASAVRKLAKLIKS